MRTGKYLSFSFPSTFTLTLAVVLGLSLSTHNLFALDTKLTCTEVDATEAKCKDYDAQSAACDAEVDAALKVKVQAAKTALDECKKKNSFQYVLKCKKEMKNSATAINTPRQVAASPVQKELSAKPDSTCAKADALGSATQICKGPKKVIETMKANCIKG